MTEPQKQILDDILLYIGIDPGTTTGLAFWYPQTKILYLHSGPLIQMYELVKRWVESTRALDEVSLIRIEDARLRKWFGGNSTAKAQGAGSIKRDCAIWEEMCKHHGWKYEMVHPVKGGTKWKAPAFKAATGYSGRTNEHERDAALLVYSA